MARRSGALPGVGVDRVRPLPAEIRAAREAAGLSARAAGELVHTTTRVWQQWEAGDRAMHPAFWELFGIKIGGHHG